MGNTRQTSIDAYTIIKSNGMISTRRQEVLDVIFEHGPITGGEIGGHMPGYRSAVSTADRNIHARLSELRNMGVITEYAIVTCSVTGRNVIQWVVSGSLPRELPKKEKSIRLTKSNIKDELASLLTEQQINSVLVSLGFKE